MSLLDWLRDTVSKQTGGKGLTVSKTWICDWDWWIEKQVKKVKEKVAKCSKN